MTWVYKAKDPIEVGDYIEYKGKLYVVAEGKEENGEFSGIMRIATRWERMKFAVRRIVKL